MDGADSAQLIATDDGMEVDRGPAVCGPLTHDESLLKEIQIDWIDFPVDDEARKGFFGVYFVRRPGLGVEKAQVTVLLPAWSA